MKIGIVTGIFHPEPGGPATTLYYLLPLIQARGHEVRVLTFGEAHAHDYGYPVTRITRQQSFPRRLIAYWRALLALARWSDALLIMGYVVHLPLLRPLYRKRIVTKIVGDYVWEYAWRHDLTRLDPVAFQTAPMNRKLRLIRWVYHYAVNRSDAILVPSAHLRGLVRGWGIPEAKIHTVYNAIPATGLHTADRSALRRELGLPVDAPLLVSIARLIPLKGVDLAVAALHHLPDAHLVVVGEGPQQPDLEAAAPDGRVHFVGRQPHNAVLRYLRAADVYVLSSRTEGLSHTLLEALEVGTPAVATRVGGNPEVITDGRDGLLVPPDDVAALTNAVRRVLADADFAARLAAAGRARSADFSWPSVVDGTLALLSS
jgi:glycosyltransferase involved in cell wall biosynthesis